MDNLEGRFNKVRYGDLKTRKRWFLTSVIILFVVIFDSPANVLLL